MNRKQLRTYGESLELKALQESWGELARYWTHFTTHGGSADLVLSEAYRLTKYARYLIAERQTSTGFKAILKGINEHAGQIFSQIMTVQYEKISRQNVNFLTTCHQITTLIRDLRDWLYIAPQKNACYEQYQTISAKYDKIDTWLYKLPYQNRTQRAV